MFAFAISVGGVLYVYCSEIIPGKVLLIPFLVQSILTVITSAFTLDLIKLVGIFSLYGFFGIIAMIGWFLFYGLSIETKGKENSEIIEEFSQKKFLD